MKIILRIIAQEIVVYLYLKVSSQFTVVFIIFSTADNCFGLLVLISTVRKTKNSLKNERIAAAHEQLSETKVRNNCLLLKKIMKTTINLLETLRNIYIYIYVTHILTENLISNLI